MRVAIVHDYLYQNGGAEKIIEKWLEMYPQADIYTSFFVPEKFTNSTTLTKAHKENRIHTTWLQWWLPKALNLYKHFFWLYPLVMSWVVVKDYEVVLISSTYCGKNIHLENCKKVIHYCHSPTRFLHDLVTETDHQSLSKIYQLVIPFFKWWLKILDLRAVKYLGEQGTIWVANSKFIQKTIREVYGVDSQVIYPAVDIEEQLAVKKSPLYGEEKFYLCHGRISFHKRLDLAIKACLELSRTLKISGTSALPRELDQLKEIVSNWQQENPDKESNIEFLGRTTDQQAKELISNTQAMIFPGKEDFGIAPIEVLAGGTPIIAYKAGGALEYIQEKVNGIYFEDQEVIDVIKAIEKFEKSKFNVPSIRETAKPFSTQMFKQSFKNLVESPK